jgi:hypothetical protein
MHEPAGAGGLAAHRLVKPASRGDGPRTPGAKVEWVVYKAEGHGWRCVENNIDFRNRVTTFLDANIGAHWTPPVNEDGAGLRIAAETPAPCRWKVFQ